MDRHIHPWTLNRNILKKIQIRQYNALYGKHLERRHQFSESFIHRIGLETELEGHSGCVNCLEWTSSGLHLASGSDDTTVIIWDPFRHKQLQVIPTVHIGNIFSVKFLADENVIATAAGDCHIVVQNINSSTDKATPLLNCTCHFGRVKRLATAPDQPSLFWSAGEDGFVFQYDLREPHACRERRDVMVNLGLNAEIKCVAINPTKSHYLAVGANDCFVRLYDRRKIKVLHEKVAANTVKQQAIHPASTADCVQYYSAGHLAHDNADMSCIKFACTYVAFNKAGSEMLVNIGGEQIYLFDVNETRHINEVQVPHLLPNRQKQLYRNCCQDTDTDLTSTPEVKYAEPTSDCACFYMKRAAKSYQRKWMSDVYGAARDYCHVIQHWPDHRQAYIGLIKCLIVLEWRAPAEKWLDHCTKTFAEWETTHQIKFLRAECDKISERPDGAEAVGPYRDVGASMRSAGEKTDAHERSVRLNSGDFERRYIGHCNTSTDIKEANFMGEDDGFICAGSDGGIIFIWNKNTMEIVRALFGDNSIVNCVQPHKSVAMMASSGIDSGVKIWAPLPETDCESKEKNRRVVQSLQTVVETNQHRMCMDPFESMLASMGFQIQENILDVQETACRPS